MKFEVFSDSCNKLASDMDFIYKPISPGIEFSNTGIRGGKKFFSITLISMISVLKDIRNNIDVFLPHCRYVEGTWRDLFSEYLSDSAVNALSTVQTLPLFTAISKIVHQVNMSAEDYRDKVVELSSANLDNAIEYLEAQVPDESMFVTQKTSAALSGVGDNIIYYGAPGTGKSHTIDDQIVESNTVRTVFHADTQNSDFMGALKPVMDGDSIKYEFRPGPFTNAIINAANQPEYHHWLVIEEINRAPAAAVFGEIFQLLDRRSDTGESQYTITLSDPDMQTYISSKAANAIKGNKLRIPGNLSLLATMNSSDQAVMPLDTAFKRRWKFRYIPLDFEAPYNGKGKACSDGDLLITNQNNEPVKISWRNFATAINNILTSSEIPEDRHLGPFFLSANELSAENNNEALTGKLFMYLWDDVLRHGMSDILFNNKIRTYGQLTRCCENKELVFNDKFYELVDGKLIRVESEQNQISELKVAEEAEGYKP